MVAPWIVNAPINRRIFEAWIETQLAPTLAPDDVVILDNVGFQKKRSGRRPAQSARRLVPVPAALFARSQPIEMAFSKLKTLRRKRAARFDAIAQALGDICNLFSITECRNYLKAAGYEPN